MESCDAQPLAILSFFVLLWSGCIYQKVGQFHRNFLRATFTGSSYKVLLAETLPEEYNAVRNDAG